MRIATKNKLVEISAVFLICFSQCSAQTAFAPEIKDQWRDLFGTELFGGNCKSVGSVGQKKELICKGVKGYSLLVKGEPLTQRGENQKPELVLIDPAGRRFQIRYWDTTNPKFQSLFGIVYWTVIHRPRKSVSLTLMARVEPSYDDRGNQDIIVRVSPGPVCVIGSVPASSTQIEESVAIASTPRGRRCLDVKKLTRRN